jgi:hypothetical protein
MLIAIDTNEVIDYVCKEDRQSEAPTVFKLAVLDSVTLGRIEDEYMKFSKKVGGSPDEAASVSVPLNRYIDEVVCFGIRGWENFQARDGSPVPFRTVSRGILGMKPREVMDPSLLVYFRRSWLTELSDALLMKNHIDKEAEKNSDAPSPKS